VGDLDLRGASLGDVEVSGTRNLGMQTGYVHENQGPSSNYHQTARSLNDRHGVNIITAVGGILEKVERIRYEELEPVLEISSFTYCGEVLSRTIHI